MRGRYLDPRFFAAFQGVTPSPLLQEVSDITIFVEDRDRERLTARVAEGAADFGVRIYLYCWMENHGHLLVEPPAGNLSAFMGSVLTGYTVYFNCRHGRSGHVMQGGFKSPLATGDECLLRLSRYIHLNPETPR